MGVVASGGGGDDKGPRHASSYFYYYETRCSEVLDGIEEVDSERRTSTVELIGFFFRLR